MRFTTLLLVSLVLLICGIDQLHAQCVQQATCGNQDCHTICTDCCAKAQNICVGVYNQLELDCVNNCIANRDQFTEDDYNQCQEICNLKQVFWNQQAEECSTMYGMCTDSCVPPSGLCTRSIQSDCQRCTTKYFSDCQNKADLCLSIEDSIENTCTLLTPFSALAPNVAAACKVVDAMTAVVTPCQAWAATCSPWAQSKCSKRCSACKPPPPSKRQLAETRSIHTQYHDLSERNTPTKDNLTKIGYTDRTSCNQLKTRLSTNATFINSTARALGTNGTVSLYNALSTLNKAIIC